MREIGMVTECVGAQARVMVLRRSACGENCASCSGGCVPTKSIITADNVVGARCGDRVVLELDDKKALNAAALVYIFPLAALFLGAIGGMWLGLGEGMSALLGFLTMVACFFVLHFANRVHARKYCVKITQILASEKEGL